MLALSERFCSEGVRLKSGLDFARMIWQLCHPIMEMIKLRLYRSDALEVRASTMQARHPKLARATKTTSRPE